MRIESVAAKAFTSSVSTNAGKKVLGSAFKEELTKNFTKVATKSKKAKFLEMLQKMKGTKGQITLTKEQIRYLPKDVQEAIKPLLKGTKNPTAEIAYKAKANYNIAAIRVKDGENLVGTGAISLTKPGNPNGVVKARLNVKDKLCANGYVDGATPLKADDVAVAVTRRGGRVKGDYEISQGAGLHFDANEKEVRNLVAGYNKSAGNKMFDSWLQKIQENLNIAHEKIRSFIGLPNTKD